MGEPKFNLITDDKRLMKKIDQMVREYLEDKKKGQLHINPLIYAMVHQLE